MESSTVDWDVFLIPGVIEIAENAAYKLADRYGLTFEFDDAFQEATFLLAGRPDRVREQMESGNSGLVYHELYRDLVDLVKWRRQHVSYDLYRDQMLDYDDGAPSPRMVAFAGCTSCGGDSHRTVECPLGSS